MNPPRRLGFEANVRGGELIGLKRHDVADVELALTCEVCGSQNWERRCDYPVKEPYQLCCDKRLCLGCAVRIFCKNNTDYCPAHAKEAGIRLHPVLAPYQKRVGLPNNVLFRKAAFAEELREATRLALTHIYAQERPHG